MVKNKAGKNKKKKKGAGGSVSLTVHPDFESKLAEDSDITPEDIVLGAIRNAYDADAQKVHVSLIWDLPDGKVEGGLDLDALVESASRLVVLDNGHGMTPRDVRYKFFKVGGSHKIKDKKSPGGRPYTGSFSFDRASSGRLANLCDLETWRQGVVTTASERYVDTKKGIPREGDTDKYKGTYDDTGYSSGTRLTFRGLKFGPKDIDLKSLAKRIEWELPSRPDFTVFINKKRVPKRGSIKNLREYFIDEEVEGVGRVHGTFSYSGKKTLDPSGVIVYVNSSSVGNDQKILVPYTDLNGSLVGMVNADGLEGTIIANRKGHTRTNKYKRVQSAITKVLDQIAEDVANEKTIKGDYDASDQVWKYLQATLFKVQKRLSKNHKTEEDETYVPTITYDEEGKWHSRIDGNNIEYNAASPLLERPEGIGIEQLEGIIYDLATKALAELRIVAQHPKAAEIFARDDEHRYDLARQLQQGYVSFLDIAKEKLAPKELVVKPLEEIDEAFSPVRLYTLEEVSERSGYDTNTLSYLFAAGALVPHREQQRGENLVFNKEDLMKCFSAIEGLEPLGRYFRRSEYERKLPIQNKIFFERGLLLMNVEYVVSRMENPDGVVNVGTPETPMMWVHPSLLTEDKRPTFNRIYAKVML